MAIPAAAGSDGCKRMRSEGRPRFSVLVACHGYGQFAERAVQSVWNQTVGDFEIVAVDDGSPDGTGRLLDDLAARSPSPMRVVHNIDGDADKAFNLAASVATGAYLAFLDADDEYAKDRLDVFGRVIDKVQSFIWGFSAVACIDEAGAFLKPEVLPDSMRAAIELSSKPIEALTSFSRMNPLVTSGNLVVQAGLFRDVGGFRPYRYVHGWDLALRLMWLAEPTIVERALYHFRVHSSTACNGSATSAEVSAMRVSLREAMGFGRDEIASVEREPDSMLDGRSALGADEQYATRAALRMLLVLRAVPPAYALVRSAARFARLANRRLRGR